MGRYKAVQFTFDKGEVAEQTLCRPDVPLYSQSAKLIRNAIITRGGALWRRPGTTFIDKLPPTEDGLYRFELIKGFDETGRLFDRVIVFGKSQAWVYKLQQIYHDGKKYRAECHRTDNGVIYFNGDDYTPEIIAEAKSCSIGRRLIFTHPLHAPFMLEWHNAAEHTADFSISNAKIKNVPYVKVYDDIIYGSELGQESLTLTQVSGGTYYFSSANETPFDDFRDDKLVGQYLVLQSGARLRIFKKLSGKKLKVIAAQKIPSLDPIAPEDYHIETGWRKSWDDVSGYPRACMVYNRRLFLAGTRSHPGLITASTIADPLDFDEGTGDADDGFCYELKGPIILHMDSENVAKIFCDRETYLCTPNPTPESFNCIRINQVGIAPNTTPQPSSEGGASLFFSSSQTSIHVLSYSDESQAYKSVDVGFYANHLITLGPRPFDGSRDRLPNGFVRVSEVDNANDVFAFINHDNQLVMAFHSSFSDDVFSSFVKQEFSNVNGLSQKQLIWIIGLFSWQGNLFLACTQDRDLRNADLLYFDRNALFDYTDVAVVEDGKITVNNVGEKYVYVSALSDGEVLGPFLADQIGYNKFEVNLKTHKYDGQDVEYGYGFFFELETNPLERPGIVDFQIGNTRNITKVIVNYAQCSSAYVTGGDDKSAARERHKFTKPFEGVKSYGGITGWGDSPTIRISQRIPGKLAIHNIGAIIEGE